MINEIDKRRLEHAFLKEISSSDNPFRRYFSYEENNTIIGFFVIDVIYEKIELINIFVKKEERNRKIGTNMLEYVIKFARGNNCKNITLEVREDNIYAIKLYENFGFKKVATRKNYYKDIDGMLMELIL